MMDPRPNQKYTVNGKPNDYASKDLPPSEQKIKKPSTSRATLAQVLAVFGFGVLLFGIGMVWSMPTIIIGGLLHNDKEEFSLSDEGASWFGSIIYVSQPLGSVASGFLQEKFGRKRSMMMVNIPQLIGWILMYFSSNVTHLYIAAVILGLSLGFMEAPALSYIGEITEPRLRGMLSSLSGSFAGIGILAEYFIGAITDWRSTCAISGVVPILAFISVSLIPESPAWLVLQGRISEAEQALCWLRGWVHPMHVREEFLLILEYTKSPALKEMTTIPSGETKEANDKAADGVHLNNKSVVQTFALLSQPKIYRPLRLILTYFAISHIASLLAVRPFLVPIFRQIGMPLEASWIVVISGGLQIVGALFGMCSMKLFGKRKTNFASLLVCIACCYLLGISLMLNDVIPWIPFGLFCALFFASGFGVVPLPWVLLSELFPLEGRGVGGGLSAAVSYLEAFVVTKTYINLSTWFGMYGTLYIYGTLGVLGLFFLYYCLPETEGKTLEEIEEFFKDKPSKKQEKQSNNVTI